LQERRTLAATVIFVIVLIILFSFVHANLVSMYALTGTAMEPSLMAATRSCQPRSMTPSAGKRTLRFRSRRQSAGTLSCWRPPTRNGCPFRRASRGRCLLRHIPTRQALFPVRLTR
jgi:hypothetical protein